MRKQININKSNFLKSFLVVFLLNILPIIFVFIGFVYIKVLELQLGDIDSQIRDELKIRTVFERQLILSDLQQNILKYINTLGDYNDEIEKLNKSIDQATENNQTLNKKIKELEYSFTELKNENIALNKKYQEVSNHEIKNVATINQYPLYPNGCEAIALTILLKYYNVNADAKSVMNALPKGSVPYYENGILYGGNPNYEFLGDPSSIYGWGIWDKGLAITANKFKSSIINGTGMDFQQVIKLVKNNRPVIVWTSIDLINPYVRMKWVYKPTGEIITWKNYNHAVVVIGYTEDTIIISDPINGQKRSMDRKKFIDVYNFMGKKAIYY